MSAATYYDDAVTFLETYEDQLRKNLADDEVIPERYFNVYDHLLGQWLEALHQEEAREEKQCQKRKRSK